MSDAVLMALIGSLTGILSALVGIYVGVRKAATDARRARAEVHHIDINALQDVISGLGKEIKRMQECLAQRDAMLNEVRQRVDALSKELSITKMENVSLRRENELLKGRVKELEEENKRLKCELSDLRMEIQRLRQRMADDDGP